MSAEFEMEYLKIDDDILSSKVELRSLATVRSGRKIKKAFDFHFEIDDGRINRMYINTVSANIEAVWEEADY